MKTKTIFGFSLKGTRDRSEALKLLLPRSKCSDTPASIKTQKIFTAFDACTLETDGEFNIDVVNSQIKSHPLPRSQGPLLPFLHLMSSDCLKWDEVMSFYTAFRHNTDQKCAKWTPNSVGTRVGICRTYAVTPYCSEANVLCQGLHSKLRTMSIVYTCIFNKCSIGCPCNLCVNSENFPCRKICKDTPCPDCNPQCKVHKIELDRRFDVNIHEVTIGIDSDNSEKSIVKHAGIPKNCQICRVDLLQHQKFHLVPHQLCKFCVQLLGPILNSGFPIVKLEDYAIAKEVFRSGLNHTCGYCLKEFDKIYKRKIHEQTQHEGKGRDFVCVDCEQTFTNINALKHHFSSKHESVPKIICEICNAKFSAKSSLTEHRITHHENSESYQCDQCNATFTVKSNMLRHKRGRHNEVNVNWSVVQTSYDLKFKCDICMKMFGRRDNLKRHMNSAHEAVNFEFKCEHCQKSFKWKSSCESHEKQCDSK